MKMVADFSSEMLSPIRKATPCHIPEGGYRTILKVFVIFPFCATYPTNLILDH
jgi:hypothetical protein